MRAASVIRVTHSPLYFGVHQGHLAIEVLLPSAARKIIARSCERQQACSIAATFKDARFNAVPVSLYHFLSESSIEMVDSVLQPE